MNRITLFCSVLVLLAIAMPASAVPVLDFGTGTAGTGGTITIVSSTAASGSGIPITTLTVSGTANDGVYNVSGTAVGSNNPTSGSLDFCFGIGGCNSITITGTVTNAPGGPVGPATLLTGTFSSFTVLANGAVVGSVNGSGPDSKYGPLLTALGIPTNTQFDFFGFSIGINSASTGSPYTAISTDIVNTAVPEPASVMFLGTVLVGLAGLARRRLSKG